MRRDQLEHAIRTACQIIHQPEVIVVGSQALGTYDESQLPTAATMSIEVDILPIADSNDETARLADPKSSKGGISVSRMTPRVPGSSPDGSTGTVRRASTPLTCGVVVEGSATGTRAPRG